MHLIDISIQYRVVIGISAMILLFASFLIVFISNQRKKLLYHKNLQTLNEQQQQTLLQQNVLLEHRVNERTAELSAQKETLQQTLTELNASQMQLVQKEKMASLGELTAGIAHEIQNPLNFVLNFGEINVELLDEMKTLIAAEALPGKFVTELNPIVNDLQDNLAKIILHGKRADGIVKNMLQHSRSNTGIMELTDLNELTDEYLKLSYYGFRSKHKAFSCSFQTMFNENVIEANIIPQDMGQILVNIFTNAFYSMNEKMKTREKEYVPTLYVSTDKKNDKLIISIRDNGLGIPNKIIQKIFQPFFTTKPTGEATGLGLSLSYDMLKAIGAELKVESTEGESATFTILLSQ